MCTVLLYGNLYSTEQKHIMQKSCDHLFLYCACRQNIMKSWNYVKLKRTTFLNLSYDNLWFICSQETLRVGNNKLMSYVSMMYSVYYITICCIGIKCI